MVTGSTDAYIYGVEDEYIRGVEEEVVGLSNSVPGQKFQKLSVLGHPLPLDLLYGGTHDSDKLNRKNTLPLLSLAGEVVAPLQKQLVEFQKIEYH